MQDYNFCDAVLVVPMTLAFTKMQAAGNDFMVVMGRSLPAPERRRIRALADRRRGVGFDQLLWVDEPRQSGGTVNYRVFNADGGEAGQCGNGALCIAALVAERRSAGEELCLKCPGGEVQARFSNGRSVSCSLGRPEWAPQRVPFEASEEDSAYAVEVDGRNWLLEVLSLGNPHAVIPVSDAAAAPVAGLGSRLSVHQRFPQGCNVGFSQTVDGHRLKLRVYERGVGETPACGTGACAAAVAGIRSSRVFSPVDVEMPGGDLRVEWGGGNEPVWLTAKIDRVYEGRVSL